MPISKLGERRIKKLIDFMESLPKRENKHFNMHYWFNHSGAHDHSIGRSVTKSALQHCGTTACALGWAATIPSFKRAGFYVETIQRGPAPFERARKFFGINDEQAQDLFSPFFGTPRTPKQWAKTARRLLRQWSKE